MKRKNWQNKIKTESRPKKLTKDHTEQIELEMIEPKTRDRNKDKFRVTLAYGRVGTWTLNLFDILALNETKKGVGILGTNSKNTQVKLIGTKIFTEDGLSYGQRKVLAEIVYRAKRKNVMGKSINKNGIIFKNNYWWREMSLEYSNDKNDKINIINRVSAEKN